MRSLRILLVVCAATMSQSTLADAQSTLAELRAACADDAQKFCAGVQLGGGRMVACLKEHKDQLSGRCKQAAGVPVNPSSSAAPSAPSVQAAAPAPVAAPSAPAASPSVAKSASAPNGAAAGVTSAGPGEKFVEQVIADTEHGGMRAATIHIPEKWHFESKIEWHYDRIEVPLIFSSQAENPDNAEAYFQYPLLRAEIVDVAPQYRRYVPPNKNKPGDRIPSGAIWSAPMPPMQALAKFIQLTRPNAANFKWIGQQDLPDRATDQS
jgi:hypothetical protein